MMIINQVNEVSSKTESSIRALLDLAYEDDFSSEDWEHTFGGQYFIGRQEETIIAHGSVVPRNMFIDGQAITVGYVEAIGVLPSHWRQGFGTQLMQQITQFCQDNYELSMLSTDENQFYERLGWRQFIGESFVRSENSEVRTSDEDAGLMLLHGTASQTKEIQRAVCESRSGDDW
jgi:aminoglycoside 2'-N-acetyltransferase I